MALKIYWRIGGPIFFDLGEFVGESLNGITQIPFDWRASTSESTAAGSRGQDYSRFAMWPSELGRQFDAKVSSRY